ncbi:hypothetical protein EIB74_14005 [Epilithonimonas vandammei]|uniref:Uncharacterized protein n=1 Tax=Epilithonimonas vandammei TaxID=2487072 RepID=A0A3G8Y6N1_9FLAO|nr:hypothetical protein EIB74_14005 [Epilithonimonas vandammei]
MPVPKIQQRPNSLPAQKRNPKNQNIKKVTRAKNAKAATAMVVVHIALADAVLQRPPYTYQSQSN